MFNFKELKLEKRGLDTLSSDSFVGIRRNIDGEIVFRLPLGFDEFPQGDFNETKRFFFKMYKVFKKFERDLLQDQVDETPKRRDQISSAGNAYEFEDSEGESTVLYSKIRMIEDLLKAHNDLAVYTLEKRLARSDKIDYSKIDKYLHKAIYLPNDVAYIEDMEMPQNIVFYDSNDLVSMFCFILSEVQNELEYEIDERVKGLAEKFREQYLSNSHSLFDEDTFEITITLLKDILEQINRQIAYKDSDYWQVYEAIETFLYGELNFDQQESDGVYWGISNFSMIWEKMCHVYAFRNFHKISERENIHSREIIYADTGSIEIEGKKISNATFGGCKVFIKEGFDNPFFLQFNQNSSQRWLRPDIILRELLYKNTGVKIEKGAHRLGVIDFQLQENGNRKNYDVIMRELKSSITGGRFTAPNIFKSYPKRELERIEKKYFQFEDETLAILDWKYHGLADYQVQELSEKVQKDIQKQLLYEYCLQQSRAVPIRNAFCIPYYFQNGNNTGDEDNSSGEYEDNVNEQFRDDKVNIQIFKTDFLKVQSEYLLAQ